MSAYRTVTLVLIVIFILGGIYYLEGRKPSGLQSSSKPISIPIRLTTEDPDEKRVYPGAKEIVSISGYINSNPFLLGDFIGKKIILIDFWTYSCINCQRTIPYINAWHEKYKDLGLLIVGVHTPEFEFEKIYENVVRAVEKFGIRYPVVLDNEYATWRSYENRYWPRKYLIDIDGSIIFDHIGEGGYADTEKRIQEALKERATKLGTGEIIPETIVTENEVNAVKAGKTGSPEVYFGALRNSLLANGKPGAIGMQTLSRPSTSLLNRLHLVGSWDIQNEFSENVSKDARIIFRYSAKNVYMVASADNGVNIKILRDGVALPQNLRGKDVSNTDESSVLIKNEDLYHLVQEQESGEHALEIIIENAGFQAFTFTFG